MEGPEYEEDEINDFEAIFSKDELLDDVWPDDDSDDNINPDDLDALDSDDI